MRRNGAAWAWTGAEEILKGKAKRLPVVESINLRAYEALYWLDGIIGLWVALELLVLL